MNKIIKYQVYNNITDQYFVINPTKQQIFSIPKEESQMFQGKKYSYTSGNSSTEISENTDTRAFAERLKSDSTPNFQSGGVGSTPTNIGLYSNVLTDINSSHTPTDYIGMSTYEVPFIISQDFTNFKLVLQDNTVSDLFSSTDNNPKLINILSGLQKLRLPKNVLNTILTSSTDILNNNGSNVLKNYGTYHIILSPKYFDVQVVSITDSTHTTWEDSINNLTDNSTQSSLVMSPNTKRRNIYSFNGSSFTDLPWVFEDNPSQSGRLLGSVVEIYNSTKTRMKQVKVVAENNFNLTTSVDLVLQPDNMGYDTEDQAILVGDIFRIYPRETYFDQIIIELEYIDKDTLVNNLVSFMINDAVRDLTNGIVEVYDNSGVNVDDSGNFNGNVVQRFQITQLNNYEVRKKIKNG